MNELTAQSHQSGFVGADHRLHTIFDPQLVEDVGDTGLHGGLAHEQLICDFLVAQAAGHPAQHVRFTRTGHHVGDVISVGFYGQPADLKLVGEIFDQQGDDILLRTRFDSVPAKLVAWDYEVQLRAGTDPVAFASAIESASPGLTARLNRENGVDTAFLLINSVLAGLAIVLGLIAASGVFNTVVLNTREKARDFAILKTVGMTPRQVTTMVLTSVAVLGVIGAAVGMPAGIGLHRYIVTVMGQIATSTGIPDQFFHVFGVDILAVLGVAGVVIALIGAMLPAQGAACGRIAEVLQTE